jgi:tetratricopeptide (TPR) repeat protein
MAGQGSSAGAGADLPSTSGKQRRTEAQQQLDFEINFFRGVLERYPEYVDVLRVLGNSLTRRGRVREGLEIDKHLLRLRPLDALVHYNLACSYALLRQADLAIKALRRALELGYNDFHYLRQDADLDTIRQDPRFRQILNEFETASPPKPASPRRSA